MSKRLFYFDEATSAFAEFRGDRCKGFNKFDLAAKSEPLFQGTFSRIWESIDGKRFVLIYYREPGASEWQEAFECGDEPTICEVA